MERALVTRKSEYAISALVELARRKGEWVTSREISQRQGIPPTLIPQLLARMGQAGWVEGKRGPSGGVRLRRDPGEISLREVVELWEGPLGLTRCLAQDGYCQNQTSCPLRGVWARAQRKMLEVLEETTIEDLAAARRVLQEQARERP